MKRLFKGLVRLLFVLGPAALGVFAIMSFAGMKSPPSAKENKVRTPPVRVITIAPVPLVPRASGYGTVTPAREWRAVARVEGEVLWASEKLANGFLVDAGEELMRLDRTGLELALAQIDAQIAAIDVKDETVRSSLEISRAELAISRADMERQKGLVSQGVLARTAADQSVRQELASRANVNTLENQLALNGAERNVLAAQRQIALRDLSFTTITAPYDMRIGQVDAEAGQYVSRGQVLVTAEGIASVEIAAQFPIGRLGPVVRSSSPKADATGPMGLAATVRLKAPGRVISWPARVDRVGDLIDPRTQSINVVVTVDQPLDQATAGQRPPLRRNMFVEVELRAPQIKAIVIPRDAVRGTTVFVVDADNQLEKREVRVAHSVGTVSVVAEGLEKGDRLVVSNMDVAMPGRTVKPVEDNALKKRIAAVALGEGSAK